ncbi:hypothetical protein TNCV_4179191 [Trichonephila clavipes]|nr:hypothetical protein TNCV_4179191 [Trichonephila clavipes]
MKHHPKIVRMHATIKKKESRILKENKQTQRYIAWKLGMSFGTIAERKTNCRKICEKHLAAEKGKFVITLDKKYNEYKEGLLSKNQRVCMENRNKEFDPGVIPRSEEPHWKSFIE